uniref:Anti-silencing function protein 1 n=1 Tax=Trichuris muris TaxID=70415 RepID=A0A5S6Q7A7_TRIMR
MGVISLVNATVMNNPATFFTPYKFEMTIEARQDLMEDLEWSVRYVGSASSVEHDQVLDRVFVGPITEGHHKFILEVPAPDPELVPPADAVDVTIIILEGFYRGKNFLKLGYFLCHDYDDPELNEQPPAEPIFEKLTRRIFDADPRLTVYPITWDDPEPEMPPPEECGEVEDEEVLEDSEEELEDETESESD